MFCNPESITTEKYVVGDYLNQINNLNKGKDILEEEGSLFFDFLNLIKKKSIFFKTKTEKLLEVVDWDHETTRKWLGKVKKGIFRKYVEKFPAKTDGKQLSRFSTARLTQIVGDPIVAQKMREEISAEMNRITMEKRKRVTEKKAITKPKGLY